MVALNRESKFYNSPAEAFVSLLFSEQEKEEKIEEELRDAVRWYRRGTITEFHDPQLDIHLDEEDLKQLSQEMKEIV